MQRKLSGYVKAECRRNGVLHGPKEAWFRGRKIRSASWKSGRRDGRDFEDFGVRAPASQHERGDVTAETYYRDDVELGPRLRTKGGKVIYTKPPVADPHYLSLYTSIPPECDHHRPQAAARKYIRNGEWERARGCLVAAFEEDTTDASNLHLLGAIGRDCDKRCDELAAAALSYAHAARTSGDELGAVTSCIQARFYANARNAQCDATLAKLADDRYRFR